MKCRIAALALSVVMAVGTLAMSVCAAPSIGNINIQPGQVLGVSGDSGGKIVVVRPYVYDEDVLLYRDTEVEKQILSLNDPAVVKPTADDEVDVNGLVVTTPESVRKALMKEQLITDDEVVGFNSDGTYTMIDINDKNKLVKIDAKDYDFAGTVWADISLTDLAHFQFLGDDGQHLRAKMKIIFRQLRGVSKVKDDTKVDISDFVIMLIHPETGQVSFIPLTANSFDPKTGAVNVNFPYLGTFILVQNLKTSGVK